MNARKKYSPNNDEKLSTSKITTFLHEHNESQPEVVNSAAATSSDEDELCITKSYRPTSPPTFTEEERQKFREGMKDIRTDGHNLRFDERRQMHYYLSEDDPEYKEHPDLENMEKDNKAAVYGRTDQVPFRLNGMVFLKSNEAYCLIVCHC